jgi:drug/metabolite transporter (DMT)-like permease
MPLWEGDFFRIDFPLKPKDWLAFIILGTVWGSSFLWIKIAVQEIGPVLLVAFRLLFGIIGLSAAAFFSRPTFPNKRRLWLALVLFGFTNSAIPYVLISWGEQYIDSAVAAILNSTTPLFTMLIATLFLQDDRLNFQRVIALLVGFTGIIILVGRDMGLSVESSIASLNAISFQTAALSVNSSLLGQGAVILASLCYAGSSVYARRVTQGLSPIVQGLVPLLGADLALWTTALWVNHPVKLPHLALTWLAIVWLGLLGTALAFLLYFYLLHSVGPTRTTLVTYMFPLVGVILGVIFLKESLDWRLLVGGSLVVGSIIIVNIKS